jgi:acetyl-CoA C-acetyltransferase
MTQQAFLYDAVRTPRGIGKAKGSLHEVKPVNLLADLFSELEQRHSFDPELIDDVVMGCVTQVGDQGGCVAKASVAMADWGDDVPAFTLNRFCASGAEAFNLGAMKVASGWEQLVVAGGVESMSRAKMGMDGGAMALDPETNLHMGFIPQGIGADLIATLGGFEREDLDAFAVRSHQKAAAAWQRGAFSKSVVPVRDRNGISILEQDELVRPDCSMETLAALKSSFLQMGEMGFDSVARDRYPQVEKIQHAHSPGNSSGIVDGAAAILIGSETIGQQLGLRPRARVVSTAVVGTDPTIMLTGPAPAARKALKIAGLTPQDIDLYEVNEAFAAVVMRFQKELDVPDEKVNVNGGSIAMGHPLGATGAMLIGTLIDELEERELRYGLVTLCVGGGMGIATIIERV